MTASSYRPPGLTEAPPAGGCGPDWPESLSPDEFWRRCLAGTAAPVSTFSEIAPDGAQLRAVPPGFEPMAGPENPFLSVYGKYGYVGEFIWNAATLAKDIYTGGFKRWKWILLEQVLVEHPAY